MTSATTKARLADLGLFYAAAIWGATFFLVKDALADIDPIILVAYRFLSAGIILLGFLVVTRRPILKGLAQGFWLGVILWLLYVPQTIGLGITTASNSGFITGLFVAFVPVFLRAIFHSKPTMMEWVASGIALLGLWVLTGGLTAVNTGDMLTLLSAITYALHVLYSDKYMKQNFDPYTLVCQQFLIVGLISVITGWVWDLDFGVHSSSALWTVGFLTLFPTLSAFVIQLFAQRIASPVRVSLFFSLEPLFAAVFAWTLGSESFVMRGAVGGLVISVALLVSGLPTPRMLQEWFGRRK